MNCPLPRPPHPSKYLRLSKKDWEEFEESPGWQAIIDNLDYGYWEVLGNLVDNDKLRKAGRDNFPEVKFERGVAYAMEVMAALPKRFAKTVEAERMTKDGRREDPGDYPGSELFRDGRGSKGDNRGSHEGRRVGKGR